jgi:hypothetical protein
MLAAGCGRETPAHGPAPHAPAVLTAYLAPPELIRADRRSGAVLLAGTSTPNAAIRLASPDGSAIAGSADGRGVWRILAPAGAAPRLYSLSETASGRLVRALGYIAVLPAPGPPAAMLHPTATATLPPADPEPGLIAVDYDGSGEAMATGQAAPGETVRLALDGKEAGEDRADAAGVFSATLLQPLTPGPHVLVVSSQRLRASAASFTATRVLHVATPPFQTQRQDGAWRIDWMTPGGGVQSTVLFDPKGGRQ